MTTPIKTAIVGFGFSAKVFHIPFIENLAPFEFTAVSTSQNDAVKETHPNVTCYATAEEMITSSDADLVIITAPNNVHYSLAKLALENGKHVVIEKPFVTHSTQGQELIELAAKQQRVLSVYHNRRWDSDFLTVKALIEEGQIGELKWFESHIDRFRPNVRQRWREDASVDGAGILYDLGSHLIDQAVTLFGVPEKITGQCYAMRKAGTPDDFFNVTFHYPTMLVQLHSDPYSPGTNLRYKLLGTEGKFIKFGMDPQEEKLRAQQDYLVPGWSIDPSSFWGTLTTEQHSQQITPVEGGYENYYLGVAAAISDDKPLPVTADQSLLVIKLIELIRESSDKGQTVEVKL